VVGFARRCAHDKAERTGDHVEQFWTLTTAAGLDLIDGYLAEAKQKFRDACNLPNTTIFEFQTIRERLVLLQDLDYTGRGVVTEAIQMVDDTVRARSRQPCKCQRVFLFAGCFLECQKISPGQLSPETLNVLEAKIRNEVETNNIGERDLVLSGLCHVSDVIFARACKDRGARVRLLVARQDGLPELSCPWFTAAPDWENKAYKLLRECETWNQDEHLGKPPEGRSVSERNQRWMANTARVESPPGELYALLLRNPAHCSETEVLERAAHRCGGLVHWIDIPPVGLAATAT
jgi:hypothetical protein